MSLTDKFLQAMDIVVDQKLAESDRDITKIGKIASQSALGEYNVYYDGNNTTPCVAISSLPYAPGTNVYVLIPKGDLSNKGLILGKESDGIFQIEQTQDGLLIGDNKTYQYIDIQNKVVWPSSSLKFGVEKQSNNQTSKQTITLWEKEVSSSISFDVEEFMEELLLYKVFYVKATFDINLAQDYEKRYGLCFSFDNGQSLELTIDDVLGNPFIINTTNKNSVQSKIFELSTNFTANIQKIEFYWENLTQNDKCLLTDLEIYTIAEQRDTWASEVSIVASRDDKTLTDDNNSITLTAHTRYLGISLNELNTALEEIKYEWKLVNKYASNGAIVLASGNSSSIEINPSRTIAYRNEIICVVSYNNRVFSSDSIEIIDENEREQEEQMEISQEASNSSLNVKINTSKGKKLDYIFLAPSGAPLVNTEQSITLNGRGSYTIDIPLECGVYGYCICKCTLINESDYVVDIDEFYVNSTFAPIDDYTVYYTAQEISIIRDDLPGTWPDGKFTISSDQILKPGDQIPQGKTAQDYWFTDATMTGWGKTYRNLWNVECVKQAGHGYLTLPNIINVHPGPVYSSDLTNNMATVMCHANGTPVEDAFNNENLTTVFQIYEDNEIIDLRDENNVWDITIHNEYVTYSKIEDSNESGIKIQITGFEEGGLEGYIEFQVTNHPELNQRFNVSKLFNGSSGAASIWISTSASIITINDEGEYVPDILIFNAVNGNGKKVSNVKWAVAKDDEQPSTIDNINSYEYALNTFKPEQKVTCSLYSLEDVLLDTETILVQRSPRAIFWAGKVFCWSSIKPDKPPTTNGLIAFDNNGEITINGVTWKKNAIPTQPTDIASIQGWQFDYIIYTDNTGSSSEVYRINEDPGEKHTITLYCGAPTKWQKSSADNLPPIESVYDETTQQSTEQQILYTNLAPWPRPETPNFTKETSSLKTSKSIFYKPSDQVSIGIYAEWEWSDEQFEPDANNPYIYSSTQEYYGDEWLSSGWSVPEVCAVYSEITTNVREANLELDGLSDANGGKGLFKRESDGSVYLNADLIRTGHLIVSSEDKQSTIFDANIDTGKVTIAGWEVTEHALVSQSVAQNEEEQETNFQDRDHVALYAINSGYNGIPISSLINNSEASLNVPMSISAGMGSTLSFCTSPQGVEVDYDDNFEQFNYEYAGDDQYLLLESPTLSYDDYSETYTNNENSQFSFNVKQTTNSEDSKIVIINGQMLYEATSFSQGLLLPYGNPTEPRLKVKVQISDSLLNKNSWTLGYCLEERNPWYDTNQPGDQWGYKKVLRTTTMTKLSGWSIWRSELTVTRIHGSGSNQKETVGAFEYDTKKNELHIYLGAAQTGELYEDNNTSTRPTLVSVQIYNEAYLQQTYTDTVTQNIQVPTILEAYSNNITQNINNCDFEVSIITDPKYSKTVSMPSFNYADTWEKPNYGSVTSTHKNIDSLSVTQIHTISNSSQQCTMRNGTSASISYPFKDVSDLIISPPSISTSYSTTLGLAYVKNAKIKKRLGETDLATQLVTKCDLDEQNPPQWLIKKYDGSDALSNVSAKIIVYYNIKRLGPAFMVLNNGDLYSTNSFLGQLSCSSVKQRLSNVDNNFRLRPTNGTITYDNEFWIKVFNFDYTFSTHPQTAWCLVAKIKLDVSGFGPGFSTWSLMHENEWASYRSS